jgi:putative addiction module CopG family antidote
LTEAISWHMLVPMAYALAKENEAFIERMLRLGRFNNQSEVVREALRRMEREETSYLNPPPLTKAQLREIYGPNPEAERHEQLAAGTALRSIRRAAKQHGRIEEL